MRIKLSSRSGNHLHFCQFIGGIYFFIQRIQGDIVPTQEINRCAANKFQPRFGQWSPMKTTCEIMVQKVLPAIRAELSRALIFEHRCTQQDVADILELSRAAVSQYVSEKRGAEVNFSEETQKEIRKFALILLDRDLPSQEKTKGMCSICSFVQKSGWLYRNAPEAKVCSICEDMDSK